MIRTLLAVALLAAGIHSPAARAETVNCMQITALPATLSTQGVYCLKKDLATQITTGAAITVDANNITLDCNGYKVGGLSAGPGTNASGIAASARQNVVVRNCNVRGFAIGVNLQGAGHTVEDNRLDGNTRIGVLVSGDGSLVRRNRIVDTGGATTSPFAFAGIYVLYSVDVLDNTVAGVTASSGSNQMAVGIYTNQNPDGEIAGNRVRGMTGDGSGFPAGIRNLSSGALRLRNNQVVGDDIGVAIYCPNAQAVATGNHLLGWPGAVVGCTSGAGNVDD